MTDVGEVEASFGERNTLTAVRLLLIGLVLAEGHAVTSQGVVDAVAISTLELIDDVARGIEGCGRKAEEHTQVNALKPDPPAYNM